MPTFSAILAIRARVSSMYALVFSSMLKILPMSAMSARTASRSRTGAVLLEQRRIMVPTPILCHSDTSPSWSSAKALRQPKMKSGSRASTTSLEG